MEWINRWLGYQSVVKYKDIWVSNLYLNKAFVVGNSSLDPDNRVGVYGVSHDCYNCPFKLEHVLTSEDSHWIVDTGAQYTWRILKPSSAEYVAHDYRRGLLCELTPELKEFGVYRLEVGRCDVEEEVSPVNIYLPLLMFCLLVLTLFGMFCLIKLFVKKRDKQNEDTQLNVQNTNDFRSLYFMRGILVMALIFVTTGGGGYPIFLRQLSGIPVAEGLFFMFVWSLGVYIPYYVDVAVNKGRTKCSIFGEIALRSIGLLLMGSIIESSVRDRLATIRLWSPLERIAVAYFVAATTYALTAGSHLVKSKKFLAKVVSSLISLEWCWLVSSLLIALMIVTIITMSSYACQPSELTPPVKDYFGQSLGLGSLREALPSCDVHRIEYFNKILVAENDVKVNIQAYGGFCKGLMGIFSTILISMIGLTHGDIYLSYEFHTDRQKLWTFWSTVFAIGAMLMVLGSFPFDFNVWPISTIILLASISGFVHTIIYTMTEKRQVSNGLVLATGVTSLVLLSGHQLFPYSFPFHWSIWYRSHFVYLLQCTWTMALWAAVGFVLMRQNVKISM